jgi:NAD+ synthase
LNRSPQESRDKVTLDAPKEVERIVSFLRRCVRKDFRRYGAVVGVSGGVDSSVVLALCVQAFGPDRVASIVMPEKESDPRSAELALRVADHFGLHAIVEDITPALEGLRCYSRRDEAIKRLIPDYDADAGYVARIVLPESLLESEVLNVFMLKVIDPQGVETSHRLPVDEFRQIVAASNFKQRTRMVYLYHHAELNHFAVVGTANKDEHDLGFFVKYGDGGVDVHPIAHLYKTQVYQLAGELGLPDEILARVPSTDTYSGGGSQQEFFFRLPFDILDPVWHGHDSGVPAEEIAAALNLTDDQVGRILDDILRKRRTTDYLRSPVMTVKAEVH